MNFPLGELWRHPFEFLEGTLKGELNVFLLRETLPPFASLPLMMGNQIDRALDLIQELVGAFKVGLE